MANKSNEIKETTFKNTKLNTVKLDWKEVYYTNCPLVSASNVDEGLGLTKKEYKKIGVKYCLHAFNPRTTGIRTTFTISTTSFASAVCFRPSRFTRTSAGPGCWGSRRCRQKAVS